MIRLRRDAEEPAFARIWREAGAEDEAFGDVNAMTRLLKDRIGWGIARGLGRVPLERVS